MKQLKTFHLKRRLQIMVCFFIIAICPLANAQTTPSVMFTWDVNVGCQQFNPAKDHAISVESIQPSNCIRVCEKSTVVYSLRGLPDLNPTVQWTVTGGIASTPVTNNNYTSSISVQWGGVGSGSITFSYVDSNNTTIMMTQCFEVISIPKALFSVYPLEVQDLIKPFVIACTGQTLYFNDLSTSVGTSGIVSWFWDFGDSANTSNYTSTAQNPTHIYTTQGNYIATLTVTNSCGCSSLYRKKIKINGEGGFEISCPGMVCEGQTSTYNLPLEAQGACNEFHYDSIGGTLGVINQSTGSVQVTWDHVDATGFGFLTFETQNGGCNLPCLNPTTIRIPVIQNHGTIQGPSSICMGNQGIYRLPQWPTTDFEWEIQGNQNGDLATLIQDGQRNEIVITPLQTGTLILKAVYTNTLLNCGGTANFTINVVDGIDFDGPLSMCQNSSSSYYTSNGEPTTWTLMNSNGVVVSSQNNSSQFDYNFVNAGTYVLAVGSLGACPGQQKTIQVMATPSLVDSNAIKVFTTSYVNASTTAICPNINYSYSLPSIPNIQYHWSVSNGVLLGSTVGDEVSVQFNGTGPAQLTVYSESMTPSVCASLPTTLTLNFVQINAALLNSNTTVCANSTSSYQVNQIGTAALYTEGESYFWSLSNPNLGSITSGQDNNQINIMWNNVNVTTVVNLNLVIYKCGISRTLSMPITIVKVPELIISPSSTTICGGTSISFTVSSNSPPIVLDPSNTVVWNFGNGDQLGGLTSPIIPFYNINGTSNIIQNVSAYIVNPNGCLGTTPTVHSIVTVLPSPTVTNSLSSTANTFCNLSDINIDMVASVSSDVISIQWFGPSGGPIPNATATSLHADSTTGFGDYYFVATNSLGCTTASNIESIYQNCASTNCPPNPYPLENNSSQLCGVISLVSSFGGAPVNTFWTIYGPDGLHDNYTNSTFTATLPGVYHTVINVSYFNSVLQTICTYSKDNLITVPFIPSFVQGVVCNANNNFTVNFTDTTSYYGGVASNCVLQYAYQNTDNNNNPYINITGSTVTLGSGNYNFRLIITYNGQSCQVVNNFSYTTIPSNQSVTVSQPDCYDYPAKFGFSATVLTTDNCIWTFEPGVENTLQFPQRVFNTSGIHSVNVVLTNRYGCSRLFDNIQVSVPEKCFKGDVVASPNPPLICKGSTVSLSYQPNADACLPTQYVWMNGDQVMSGYGNTSSIQVTTPGIYWVKVKNTNCSYDTPSRISPQFMLPSSLKINGPQSICEGNEALFTAVSNGASIRWSIDGTTYSMYDDQWSIQIDNLSVGVHSINASVSSNSSNCVVTATQYLNVMPAPQIPTITQEVICAGEDTNHPAFHVELTASSNVNEYYNWSNGMSTKVYATGVYLVVIRTNNGIIYQQKLILE